MFKFIANLLDPYTELRSTVTDRNWHLWQAGDSWQILDSEGKVLAAAILPTEAYLKAIYQPCQH